MNRRVAIIGAGITGLTAAYRLRQQPNTEVVVYESTHRAGGWIRSEQHGGYLFEGGPRSCRVAGSGRATLELVRELGLTDRLIPASKQARRRYLYLDGRLQPMPSGLLSMLTSPVTRRYLGALWREWRTPPSDRDISVDAFFRRRLGDGLTNTLIDAMITGIYAGDPKQLSVQACLPAAFALEQQRGSMLKSALLDKRKKKPLPTWMRQYAPIFTFAGGMQTLTDALADAVEPSLRLGCPANTIELGDDGAAVNGESFDQVFATVGPQVLDRVIPQISLPKAPASSVAIVAIGLKQPPPPYDGFGYLIPAQEQQPLLGCVWDGAVFPEQQPGGAVMSVMLGGARRPEIVDYDDQLLTTMAVEGVSEHLGSTIIPDCIHVFRARAAIPQYPVGYRDALAASRRELPKSLSVGGAQYDGVSVGDCISAGEAWGS